MQTNQQTFQPRGPTSRELLHVERNSSALAANLSNVHMEQTDYDRIAAEYERACIIKSKIPAEMKEEFFRLMDSNAELRAKIAPLAQQVQANGERISEIKIAVAATESKFKVGDTIEFTRGFRRNPYRGRIVGFHGSGILECVRILKSGKEGRPIHAYENTSKKIEVAS